MTATAKRAKKHIKEDQLVTTAVRASEWAQNHFNQVIIGVVALVAAVAVVVFVANSRNSNARQAERLMGSAMVLMQRGDLKSAQSSFEQISQRQGGGHAVAARFFKAECELGQGNFAGAAADYEAYLARKNDYPVFTASAYIGLGLAQEGAQEWAKAATAMAEALKVLDKEDPRYNDTAYRAAYCYEKASNKDEALKYYEMVADAATGSLRDRARYAVTALQ